MEKEYSLECCKCKTEIKFDKYVPSNSVKCPKCQFENGIPADFLKKIRSTSVDYEFYDDVPWYRKSTLNSIFVILSLFGFVIPLAGLLIYITVYSLITGDIYYNSLDKDQNLKKWSSGNRIVALIFGILLLIRIIAMFTYVLK